MRSYLLDEVAVGLKKCSPGIVAKVLADSFTATLAIPEHEEEFNEKRRRLFSQHHQPDPSALEQLFILQEKHTLQTSALKHLLGVDEAKLESLLPQAAPVVRADLLKEATAHAVRAKKFDHALVLLRKSTSKDWLPYGFPYGEATRLMLDLPSERDVDKKGVFRLAMSADAERHSLPSGTEDFASMIVRFWKQIPPSLALDAIHQVLDKAHLEVEGATFGAATVNARFRNEHDYRVFELLPVLRQLDSDEADRLLQTSVQAQVQLKQYPEGIESSAHSNENSGDTAVRGLAGSIGAFGQPDTDLMSEVNESNRRVFQIARMAEGIPDKR